MNREHWDVRRFAEYFTENIEMSDTCKVLCSHANLLRISCESDEHLEFHFKLVQLSASELWLPFLCHFYVFWGGFLSHSFGATSGSPQRPQGTRERQDLWTFIIVSWLWDDSDSAAWYSAVHGMAPCGVVHGSTLLRGTSISAIDIFFASQVTVAPHSSPSDFMSGNFSPPLRLLRASKPNLRPFATASSRTIWRPRKPNADPLSDAFVDAGGGYCDGLGRDPWEDPFHDPLFGDGSPADPFANPFFFYRWFCDGAGADPWTDLFRDPFFRHVCLRRCVSGPVASHASYHQI